jgi:hypothetical protein
MRAKWILRYVWIIIGLMMLTYALIYVENNGIKGLAEYVWYGKNRPAEVCVESK